MPIFQSADNHKRSWNDMLAWLRQKHWQCMSFDGVVYLVLLVPAVNLQMMPVAVAEAPKTRLYFIRPATHSTLTLDFIRGIPVAH